MIQILAGGDYRPDSSLVNGEDFNLSYFDEISGLVEQCDLAIFNLETVIGASSGKIVKTGVSFSVEDTALNLFENNDKVVLSLANNHINDYGKNGVEGTISALSKKNIKYVGAGLSDEESRKPRILEISGVKVGILSYCEHEFSTSDVYGHGANGYSSEKVFYDIKQLRKKVDKIIVSYHGNIEYYLLPSPELKKRLRFIADLGADAVLCHHSHYYSGYEVYNEVPIFYGLGNFYTTSKAKHTEEFYTGLLVKLDISDNINFEVLPFRQNWNGEKWSLLKGEEKQLFLSKLESLNAIISDDKQLAEAWQKNVLKNAPKYYYILKQRNKILYKLIKMGLFKENGISGKYLSFLMNIIQNESHRESVLTLLKIEYKDFNEN